MVILRINKFFSINMLRLFYILSFFILSPVLLFGQTTEHAAWMSIFNTTKFSEHWGLQLDAQFRSSDDVKYLRNFLFRPAVLYTIDKKNSVALGYAMFDANTPAPSASLTENRIYQQYTHNEAIKAIAITNRFRLEQRFVEKSPNNIAFSQRFRYFLRAVIPLAKQESTFKKGIYAAVQDEIFINVQNKDLVNGSMFDQNRAYSALGHRFNTKVDAEIGYINLFQKRSSTDLRNNVVQLALYLRL